MRWAGHVVRRGKRKNENKLLVGKLEGRRSLGRIKGRWVDTIMMDLAEIGLDGGDWIRPAQDMYIRSALVKAVENFRVP
jgi:hypothetical protein